MRMILVFFSLTETRKSHVNRCFQKHIPCNVRGKSRHTCLAAESLEQDPEDTASKPAFASGSLFDFVCVRKFPHRSCL